MTSSNLPPESLVTVSLNTEPGPGERLRKAREAAGLSIDEVSAHLFVSAAVLRDLENDNYQRIAAETFVTGYLRNYARSLKIDPQPVLDAYLARRGPEDEPEPLKPVTAPVIMNERRQRRQPAVMILSVIALISLGWLIYALVMTASPVMDSGAPVLTESGGQPQSIALPLSTNDGASEADAAADVAENADEATAASASTPVVSSPAALSPAAVSSTALSSTTLAPPANPAAPAMTGGYPPPAASVSTSPVVADEEVSEAATLDELVFVFSDECWLEVTDGRGDVLSADLHQKGDTVVLQGKEPFNVLVGNVRAVTASFNGKPVALETDGIRRTLRTTIGQ